MRRTLLLFLCCLPVLANATDRYHLARVLVTGSERYREDDLVRATGLKPDSDVTKDDLQDAANRLGNSGAFTSVQFLFKPAIGTKGVEADFQVTDAEKFLPAMFENFVWFSEDELLNAVHQAVPLYNGQLPTSGAMADEISAALTRLLAAKGLPNEVSYILAAEFGQVPTAYKFKVDNANVRINEISVTGAPHVVPETLARALATLKNASYLRSDVLKMLEKTLVPLYRQHGYLKFALSGIRVSVAGKELVNVEVTANEGEQYRLAGFSWSGNTLIPSDELTKRISLKTGEPVNAVQLDRDLVLVRKLFGKFGREGVVITPNVSFAAGNATYSFDVAEGELYHMGKLEIEGVEPEQGRKLAQGWKLSEGEPYDSTYVQQFLAHTVLKVPGHKWEWMTFEQVDDTQKTVNVRLQVKIE